MIPTTSQTSDPVQAAPAQPAQPVQTPTQPASTQPAIVSQPAGITSPAQNLNSQGIIPNVPGHAQPDPLATSQESVATTAPDGQTTPKTPTPVATEGDTKPQASPGSVAFELTDQVLRDNLGYKDVDGQPWFIHEALDDTGTTVQYRSLEDARKGAIERERHFHRLNTKNTALTTALERERSIRAQKEADLNRFSSQIPEAQLDAAFEQKYLEESAPEFQGITSADMLTTPESQAKWNKAMINAKARVMVEKQERERQQAEESSARQKALESAAAFRDRLADDKQIVANWGVSNTEQLAALEDFLARPSGRQLSTGEPVTLADELSFIHVAMGPEVAAVYQRGLRESFATEYLSRQPSAIPAAPAAPVSTTGTLGADVVAGTISIQPENPPTPPTETIIEGFATPATAPATPGDVTKLSARDRLSSGANSFIRAPQGAANQLSRR